MDLRALLWGLDKQKYVQYWHIVATQTFAGNVAIVPGLQAGGLYLIGGWLMEEGE